MRRPDRLLVPSAKALPPAQPGQIPTRLDQHQCYRFGGDDDDDDGSGFRRRSVTLTD